MLFLQKVNDCPYTGLLKNGMASLMRLFDKKDTFNYETLRRGIQHVPIFWGGAEGFTHTQKMRLLSPRLRNKFSRMTSWEAIKPIYDRYMQKSLDGSPLNWMSYLDLNLRLPELLLMRVDKMSMGVGLEARVPFLDHNIVELALSIPEKIKIRNGNLKHILKTSVQGLIPAKIINRKKQGFTVPFNEWLNEGLKTRIRDDMLEFCKQTDYLDLKVVNEYLEKPKFRELWYLENLALWWNEFIR
jgi:asparagine synthase (glutamine-hydrolysing)